MCRVWRELDGNIAIEIALVAPILLAVLVGVTDYGRAALADMRLKSAIRAGLEYAQIKPDDASTIVAVVKTAAKDPDLLVTTEFSSQCANGTVAQCTATCADGLTPGGYVSISAQQTFTPLFPAMTSFIGENQQAAGSIRAK